VVGGDDQQVIRLQRRQERRQELVESLQAVRIRAYVAAMAPEHVEIDEVRKN
jgi:hypothetical protein